MSAALSGLQGDAAPRPANQPRGQAAFPPCPRCSATSCMAHPRGRSGDACAAGVDCSVAHGDLVRFGSIVFQCFEPKKLHSVLQRFIAAR